MALAECADSIGDRYADLSDASNRIETALEDSNLTATVSSPLWVCMCDSRVEFREHTYRPCRPCRHPVDPVDYRGSFLVDPCLQETSSQI